MTRRNAAVLLITLSFYSVRLQAQTSAEALRGPDETARTVVPGIEVLPFPGLPFSATDTLVRTRTTPDGATITTSETAKVFRDGQGRLYRERHRLVPAGVEPETTLYEFTILDPINNTRTNCILASHECMVSNYRARLNYALTPEGPFDRGRQTLARESLGEQTIDGLQVTGTRETITISPLTIGNDRPVILSRDFWYSPELKTNLAVTRNDPREGTQEIRLKVLSRDEPDPSVFAVPAGYTTRDMRRGLVNPLQ